MMRQGDNQTMRLLDNQAGSAVAGGVSPSRCFPSRLRCAISLSLYVLVSLGSLPLALPLAAAEDGEALFARRVQPLLKEKCLACHGDDKAKLNGDFDMRSLSGLLQGGESKQPAIVPGKPGESPLYLSVLRTHDEWQAMPPKDNDKLDAIQTAYIKDWISAGAPWPDAARMAELLRQPDKWSVEKGMAVKTSGGLSTDWTERRYAEEDLWAYKPLAQVNVPENGESHPIDAFIADKLATQKLSPALEADARSLVRRLTLDMTGLPATADEVEKFQEECREGNRNAYERLVHRLLESQHYGEQMARRWLDVVRYADTAGFANDFERPNAWRYRDYVVRSFNQDKPFDQFIKEQIAGDEIIASKEKEATASSDLLVATTFLRLGPWEHTSMAVAAETRQQWLDDVVNAVGNSFLGLEMSCFRCHDHKFDPLPTRDYYSMQAIFAPAQFADLEAPFLPEEEKAVAQLKTAQERTKKLAENSSEKKGVNKAAQRRMERWPKAYEAIVMGVYNGPPRNSGSDKASNPPPAADKRNGDVMPVHLLRRGSLADPAEEVQPAVLSIISGLSSGTCETPEIASSLDGRRLALASWIADSRHPLTARVIVNRVWGWHFGGHPLVATPNNFGVKGSKPSHPELLDWLTGWFIDNGWSIKKLDELIVTSAAYRRSLHHPQPEQLAKIDPEGKWLAAFPMRRLTAEELRDAMLMVSGELSFEPGGPPARQQMNWDAALAPVRLMSGIDIPYRPALTPAERNRRSVYTFQMRSRRDPWMEVFDQPPNELSCERRNESVVVPQAFTMMNGDFPNDRAMALATKLSRESNEDGACISNAYRALYGRQPSTHELERCRAYLAAQLEHHRQYPPAKSSIRDQVAAVSKIEPDYAADYIPDLQPEDASAQTRALADLCLVLFNTSEFLYLP